MKTVADLAPIGQHSAFTMAIPVCHRNPEISFKPICLPHRERLRTGQDPLDWQGGKLSFSKKVDEGKEGAGIYMKKNRPQLTRPSTQIEPISHAGASGDNPPILKLIEVVQS